MRVRPATAADAGAVQAIYAWHVEYGTGSFEVVPPSVDEMQARMAAVAERGLPWVVAETDERIVAYAYAGPFRLRPAYRYTAEDSVYVAPDFQRRSAGKAALAAVVAACEAMGLHQLLGVIGGSDNTGSIALHAALGFEHMGITPGLGWKHGAWRDVVWMQKALNGGASVPPAGEGLAL